MRIKSEFTRKTVLFCCLGMLLCIAMFGMAWSVAVKPLSWYRNLTGHHLSLEEPPNIVRVGLTKDFPEVGVYTRSRTDGVWIVRLPQSKLVAIHTSCTHDGCSTNWVPVESQFKCPCCGSEFEMDGTNSRGLADLPLERRKIYLHRDSVMVNRSVAFRQYSGEWQLPGASLSMRDK